MIDRRIRLAAGSLLLAGLAVGCLRDARSGEQSAATDPPVSSEQVLAEAGRVEGLQSLLAKRDGRLLLEGYFEGADADSLLHLRSATKSVTSLLVGIAIDQDLIESVDQDLRALLGPTVERFGEDKGRLTLRHLLTMTAGLEWNEIGNVDEFNRFVVSADPVAHYLSRPIVARPGKTWAYSSGASHLLSVVLSEVTGMRASEYARRFLFEPLGIDRFRWPDLAGGHTNGSAGLQLRPRDSLKLGELVLARGAWEGRQVVSAEWIDTSTRGHVDAGGGTRYGFQWWVSPPESVVMVRASGYAGQLIAIVPELDAVAVTNCRWRRLGRSSSEQVEEVGRFLSARVGPFIAPEIEQPER